MRDVQAPPTVGKAHETFLAPAKTWANTTINRYFTKRVNSLTNHSELEPDICVVEMDNKPTELKTDEITLRDEIMEETDGCKDAYNFVKYELTEVYAETYYELHPSRS